MINLTGVGRGFSKNNAINNGNNKSNNYTNPSLFQTKDSVSFAGKERHKLIQILKKKAVQEGWPDFYTGEVLVGRGNPGSKVREETEITTDHVFPRSKAHQAKKRLGITSIDAIVNVVFTNSANNRNKDKRLVTDLYNSDPKAIENGKKALEFYKKASIPEMNFSGEEWVKGLKVTFNTIIGREVF